MAVVVVVVVAAVVAVVVAVVLLLVATQTEQLPHQPRAKAQSAKRAWLRWPQTVPRRTSVRWCVCAMVSES